VTPLEPLMSRTLIAALAVLATHAPAPKDVACPVCGFWYQDTAGHSCTPC
jgi:hypothetical protein